ncbi:MAG: chemotaxis response regulator protein-glutamate methylesterase, partial [Armatimonadota bacterium]|nr:chemotaxis response regulator protein-glutamate methylesterase [Armatimonadota bacterium]
ANGRIALQKILQCAPDVVTLDIEMPELDGLQALREIRRRHPRLPVIMFSTLTERGAVKTLEALALGATDYVTKPANVGGVAEGLQRVREDLVPKIKAICGRSNPAPAVPVVGRAEAAGASTSRVDVVAVGVSTGGPNALARIVPALPAAFPVPVLIVQHMPPLFTAILADRLDAQAALAVREARSGDPLRPGVVYLAPGGQHMVVRRHGVDPVVDLTQTPPENSCRPSVDVLFRSVAALFGPGALAVVLTGMGEDGTRGARAIRDAGGQVLAQDEATSVVWGMPGQVVRAGLADRVLPLDLIAPELVRRTGGRALTPGGPARVVQPPGSTERSASP